MFFASVAALLGLIIGSFLNVLIVRHGVKGVGGRSGCMSCGHTLSVLDLVPVFSWISLRGRCRYCGSKISIQYPLVEAVTALLFGLVAYPAQGIVVTGPLGVAIILLSFAMVAIFVAIAVYDLRHTIIPDSWVYLFAAAALIYGILTTPPDFPIVWTLVAGPLAALPFAAMWFFSEGRWMGFGDAKLALGIGWLLGIEYSWAAILLAFVLGAVVSVAILLPVKYLPKLGITSLEGIVGRFTMKSEVAFGPFLVCGSLIIWLLLLYGIDPVALYAAVLS